MDSPVELSPLAAVTAFHKLDATGQRAVYPYSIIPGGIVSAAELRSAMAHDPVVAAHYAAFDLTKARVFRLQAARSEYVSYRRGDEVFWTSKKIRLALGETLITDGQHISRTRCGNQISDAPRMPVSLAGDPEPQILDRPVISQIIEPFVPPIAGEIERGGLPAGALFFGLTGAAGSGGGTIGGAAIWAVPIIPLTGGESSSPGSPPPISTPEPASIISLSTGLGAAWLFRQTPQDIDLRCSRESNSPRRLRECAEWRSNVDTTQDWMVRRGTKTLFRIEIAIPAGQRSRAPMNHTASNPAASFLGERGLLA